MENIIVKCPSCGTKNRIPSHRLNETPVCGKCRASLKDVIGAGKPINITDSSFNREVIEHPGAVLVDCWAPWCGPCRMVSPILDEIATEYMGRVKIVKLNTDENPGVSSQYGIRSIPTLLIFRNGKQVDKIIGALPRQEIERRLISILR
ncbi:MAG: thioredoxin TrxC [Deltaproteobacteria bacterium]|nr:thioredoxin TrxC [Deltaproteobacteria bacterium]